MYALKEISAVLLWAIFATKSKLMTVGKHSFGCYIVGCSVWVDELRINSLRPFLQLIVGSNLPAASVVPHDAGAICRGQLKAVLGIVAIGCCVSYACLCIVRNDLAFRVGTQLMAKTVSQAKSQLVLLRDFLGVLYSEVELIAVDCGCIIA